MRHLKLADPDTQIRTPGPLGKCLIQLDSRPQPVTDSALTPPPASESWEHQWKTNQEGISKRLIMIQEELNRLEQLDHETPHLSVYGGVRSGI